MKSEQLITDLLKQEENGQLEFKEVVRKDNIGKTICGFLNNQGGQLLIGIKDNKTVVGVRDAQLLCKDIELFLLEELVPEAPIMVSIEEYGDKELLLIKVWEGSKQPYIFRGSIYYRRDNKTVQATSKEISALIHKRQETEIHWERQAALGVDLDDLDMEEVQKTFDSARLDLKLNIEQFEPYQFMSYYGLYQNGNFTNAAVLLFAKNPARFIPQTRVRLALLEYGKTGDEFTDDRLLDGNIFKNRAAILDFFDKHLRFRRKFGQNDWGRDDDYEIPMKALREGIMNSLVHREYSSPSSAMSVLIYPDRIEVTNSGKSPYKQKELLKSHLSLPYNPDIAHMVFLRGFIEKIGRGTIMIAEECRKAGLKAPIWEIGEQTVKLTFFSKTRLAGAIDGANKGAIDGADRGAIDGANKGAVEGAVEGAIKGTTKGVREKLTVLLNAIVANEGGRVPDYESVIGVSASSIERYIRQLRDGGLVEFKGEASQTGGYYLTDKMREQLHIEYDLELTTQELELLKMLSKGDNQVEVARELNLAISTVEKMILSLKTAFNAKNTMHLVKILSDLKKI